MVATTTSSSKESSQNGKIKPIKRAESGSSCLSALNSIKCGCTVSVTFLVVKLNLTFFQVLAAIGSAIEGCSDICGVVVSVRRSADKITFWTKSGQNEELTKQIGYVTDLKFALIFKAIN